MKVGLFIPCYINELFPDVAMATYKLLTKYKLDVDFPMDQTCCGQPLYNSGCSNDTKPCAKNFINIFKDYDYIVAPSGSCVAMVKHNYKKIDDTAHLVDSKIYELVEFLVDIVKIDITDVTFNAKVGLHNSCHAHRELNLASKSELGESSYSKILTLLQNVRGLHIVSPKRIDECCGFGGTFALNEVDVSTQMGNDRINEHIDNEVEYITAVDISCLMHMQGLIDKQNLPLKTIHIAEILLGEVS
jgi:L-lactate dehydrogenase complex protein LldE